MVPLATSPSTGGVQRPCLDHPLLLSSISLRPGLGTNGGHKGDKGTGRGRSTVIVPESGGHGGRTGPQQQRGCPSVPGLGASRNKGRRRGHEGPQGPRRVGPAGPCREEGADSKREVRGSRQGEEGKSSNPDSIRVPLNPCPSPYPQGSTAQEGQSNRAPRAVQWSKGAAQGPEGSRWGGGLTAGGRSISARGWGAGEGDGTFQLLQGPSEGLQAPTSQTGDKSGEVPWLNPARLHLACSLLLPSPNGPDP